VLRLSNCRPPHPSCLAFAGISPPSVRVYPVESQIAEKLHAYTMPRKHPNTRTKKLPGFERLATTGPVEGDRVRAALDLNWRNKNGRAA
jgi:hypothetical protein